MDRYRYTRWNDACGGRFDGDNLDIVGMKAIKEISKGRAPIKYRYYNIHVDIFVSLSGSVIILISSIESNMNTKYIKGNWKIIELISF